MCAFASCKRILLLNDIHMFRGEVYPDTIITQLHVRTNYLLGGIYFVLRSQHLIKDLRHITVLFVYRFVKLINPPQKTPALSTNLQMSQLQSGAPSPPLMPPDPS